jgi:hypothetical protein
MVDSATFSLWIEDALMCKSPLEAPIQFCSVVTAWQWPTAATALDSVILPLLREA